MLFSFFFFLLNKLQQFDRKRTPFPHPQVFSKIATHKSPIITRFNSRVLRNHENISFHPEPSKRAAIISSSDAMNLGAQLNEILNRFNELSVEMVAQRHMIDQLV